MKFFMPAAADGEQAETAYQAIRKFMTDNFGPLLETRYYAIYYTHNGGELRSRVGDPEPLTGEVVCAIFRTERDNGPFLVCTPNRGVIRGHPVLASGDARAIRFEND